MMPALIDAARHFLGGLDCRMGWRVSGAGLYNNLSREM
jgi:hypothetical protein